MTQHDNGIDLSNLTDDQVLRQLALLWKARREALGLKAKTAKHTEQAFSFFLGAFRAMEMCGRRPPPAALLLLAVARDPVELWAKE